MNWILKKFDELSVQELYALLRLRNEVFVVEQNCVYQDLDDKDQAAWHLMAWKNDTLAAYTRILSPGISYKEASIGRVVTSPSQRGTGIGKELMQRSIQCVYDLFGRTPIRIGAQLYLQHFYTALGFTPTSDVYDEDGIDHIVMLLS